MKRCLQFQVGPAEADLRLDRFLALKLGSLSRMRINSLLLQGECSVNEETRPPGYHLQSGDLVEITIVENEPTAMTPEDIPLEVIYEDPHIMVVDKPAGMLVHPTRGEKQGTLANALAYHLNRTAVAGQAPLNQGPVVRPGLVHRLDRATSGLMVIAKQARAHAILTRHFHRRLVEKRYLALVHGRLEQDELAINAPIGRDPQAHPKWNVAAEGKPAETRLRVIERRDRSCLVELEPVTGRTNQLRIHCAHIGHAILGDEWYGCDSLKRLCLHAAHLSFHHPSGGDWMEFSSPLPAEIKKQLSIESDK
jgi:23S rRNA pseudouridine1911/1915/1917 synthase